MDQKKKDVLFSSMSLLCFQIFGHKITLICVLIIWLNVSHHYYIVHVVWYQPIYTFTKMLSMTWVLIFKREKKKPKHLQPTYLWNYCTKMKQKIKSFENEITQKKLIK
jgi:hypothetical protein